MIIIILSIIYIISFILSWLYIHISHSKRGIFYKYNVELEKCFLFCIIPIVNTFFFVVGWTMYYPYKYNKNNFFYKFFKIRKDD